MVTSDEDDVSLQKEVTSDEEDAVFLQEVQTEVFHRLLPLIVILIILGIIGFVGNLFAIIFYFTKTKRTSAIALIACLAIADLIVCVLVIPNIVEMSVTVMYTEGFPCKLSHFVGLWTIACSCLILCVIAIDRHRKICRPFGKHFELRHVKYTVIGIVIFGFFLSVRDFATFDTTTVSVTTADTNRTVTGHYCTTRDEDSYAVAVTIFSTIDFLIMLIVWTILVVTYSHIIYTLYKVIKAEAKLDETAPTRTNNTSGAQNHGHKDGNNLSYISDTDDSDGRPIASVTVPSDFSSVEHDEFSNTSCEHGTMDTSAKTHNIKKNTAMCAVERNLTIMMFVVSIVFFVCFTPYFVVKILMRSVFKTGEEFELGLGVQFALRLPYMNSVFNPIIYCYFNPHFRDYIKRTVLSCFRRKHVIARTM